MLKWVLLINGEEWRPVARWAIIGPSTGRVGAPALPNVGENSGTVRWKDPKEAPGRRERGKHSVTGKWRWS